MSKMPRYLNLGEYVYEQAKKTPDKVVFKDEEDSITFKVLYEKASTLAVELLKKAKKGDRALLIYSASVDFNIAFYACALAGIIAIPSYPPVNSLFSKKLSLIIKDCNPKLLLTTSSIYRKLLVGKSLAYLKPFLAPINPRFFSKIDEEFFREMRSCRTVLTDKVVKNSVAIPMTDLPLIESKDLIFLQYTSGSTGTTKGVMVAHGNVIANITDMSDFFPIESSYRTVTWLPHFHDLGLVAGTLIPLMSGGSCIIMSPADLIKSPISWLRKTSQEKATATGGPTYAFHMALKIDDSELDGLDFSHINCAFCGAEPIRQDILEKFAKKFEKCNFDPKCFYYCYGAAESVVFVSRSVNYDKNTQNYFDSQKLHHEQKAVPSNSEEGLRVISCGQWPESQIIRIINPDTQTILEDGQVGKILINSPSVCQGYWNKPELSDKIFRFKLEDGKAYLDTGDQGFIYDHELFILGRFKEILIIHGVNYNPEPIERLVESKIQKVRTGGVAAIQVNNVDEDTLTLFVEINNQNTSELAQIGQEITDAILGQFSLRVRKIYFVKPKFIPKTTSGKLTRFKLQEMLERPDISLIYDDKQVKGSLRQGETESLEEKAFKEICLLAKKLSGEQIKKQDRLEIAFRDSLMLMQLLSQLEISLNCEELPYSLLTQSINFEELIHKSVEWVKTHEKSIHQNQTLSNDGWLPATPMSKMIVEWIGLKREFNLSYVCDLQKEVSAEELSKALIKLVQLQPYLSSAYIKEKNAFKVTKDIPLEEYFERRIVSLHDEEMKAYLEKCISEISDSLFVQKAPLFKAVFVENEKEKKKHLILIISHLITDPYSLGLWFEQLEMLLLQNEERVAKVSLQIDQEMKKVEKVFSLESPQLKEIHHQPHAFAKETFHCVNFDKQTIGRIEQCLKEQEINIDSFLMGVSILALRECGLDSEKIQFIHNGRTLIDSDHPLRHLIAWLNLSWPISIPSEDKDKVNFFRKLNDSTNTSLKQALVANQKTWYGSANQETFDPYAAKIEYSRVGFNHFHTPHGVFTTSTYFLNDYFHGKTFDEELPHYRKAFIRPILHEEQILLLFFLSHPVEEGQVDTEVRVILEEVLRAFYYERILAIKF